MSDTKAVAEKQLKDFCSFKRVQNQGRYNMLSPEARAATGLSKEEYLFVLNNYAALEVLAKCANSN